MWLVLSNQSALFRQGSVVLTLRRLLGLTKSELVLNLRGSDLHRCEWCQRRRHHSRRAGWSGPCPQSAGRPGQDLWFAQAPCWSHVSRLRRCTLKCREMSSLNKRLKAHQHDVHVTYVAAADSCNFAEIGNFRMVYSATVCLILACIKRTPCR